MKWWEVNHYLAGLNRRHRTAWENTRSLQWFLTCMFTDSKKHVPPKTPTDLYKFAWEDEEEKRNQPVMTEEEYRKEQELLNNISWQ